MFAGVILICGLPVGVPTAVDGCAIAFARIPYREEQQCIQAQDNFVDNLILQLPQGAYLADRRCMKLSTTL